MMLRSSPAWLPAGWTLQSRVQKTGRKITHVGNEGLVGERREGWFVELKTHKSGASSGRQFKVVIEKYPADDLPPGWIKELKIRRDTREKRKDPVWNFLFQLMFGSITPLLFPFHF
ncbi:hypothetical protein SLEP1_g8676 [Rubroshorea leprosula]|uniref:Uncharacterized protein n=1 Tax=Rubroshorea leprosula TaxID=152421 RepID=A0AAV5IC94_9ROSI|nr:hypothetical protein SLEP1_g8676 [Rubroshorea leprosula]